MNEYNLPYKLPMNFHTNDKGEIKNHQFYNNSFHRRCKEGRILLNGLVGKNMDFVLRKIRNLFKSDDKFELFLKYNVEGYDNIQHRSDKKYYVKNNILYKVKDTPKQVNKNGVQLTKPKVINPYVDLPFDFLNDKPLYFWIVDKVRQYSYLQKELATPLEDEHDRLKGLQGYYYKSYVMRVRKRQKDQFKNLNILLENISNGNLRSWFKSKEYFKLYQKDCHHFD